MIGKVQTPIQGLSVLFQLSLPRTQPNLHTHWIYYHTPSLRFWRSLHEYLVFCLLVSIWLLLFSKQHQLLHWIAWCLRDPLSSLHSQRFSSLLFSWRFLQLVFSRLRVSLSLALSLKRLFFSLSRSFFWRVGKKPDYHSGKQKKIRGATDAFLS